MRKAELFINKKKQAGQSLIEVLIALTVTIVMIVALIAFVLTGLKNAQLAQNQSKATKYAQEALEKIKAIRDRNGQVVFAYSTLACTWSGCIRGVDASNDCAAICGESNEIAQPNCPNYPIAQGPYCSIRYGPDFCDESSYSPDQECTGSLSGAGRLSGRCCCCQSSTPNTFSELWSHNLSSDGSPCTIRPSGSTECYFKISSSGNFLEEPVNNNSLSENLENGLLRQILFEDAASSYGSEKKVTVKVKWTDSSGEHESNIQTILKPVI